MMERVQLPEAFVQRIGGQLGEELPAFLSALEGTPLRGLRMNPFREGGEKPFRDAGRAIPWARNAWELDLNSPAGTTVAHEAGAFYLQEPCAMLPAAVMAARPGEKILDLCAAPGGKSTQIGTDLAGEGLLVCNEPVPSRAGILSRNIERMGIPNAIVTCAYPEQLAKNWPEGFDGVMVDAPCSGEGMFRRHPETQREWTPEKAAGCALRQAEILDRAAEMVRPGGRLIYSTCTWNPVENEGQVSRFMDRHPEFSLEPFEVSGIAGEKGYYTCWLHRTRGEGQFVAKLRKAGEAEANLPAAEGAFRPPAEAYRIWQQSGIRTETPNAAFGQTLTRLEIVPNLKGIHVLRLGLHLGQIRGKLFLPDHASAVGMRRPDMPKVALTDEEALKYMAGETIPGDVKGWAVMTWQGLALGWGKGSDGMMKNHYPKGLRNGKLII